MTTTESTPRIHPSWFKAGGLALEIMQGKHDDQLDAISQACKSRLKDRFRRGAKVRLQGTRNVDLDGQEATIVKVNAKTVTVGLGDKDEFGYEREYNVPPHMLVAV